MKNKLLIFMTAAAALLVLASCQSTDNGDLPETIPISAETESVAPETAPVVLELTAAEEEEITALFNRMIEYQGHCLEPLMLTADGKVEAYNKVVDERFDTWEEWMAFVASIYTGEKLEQVIDRMEREGHFVNMDGYTYVSAYSGTDFLSKDFTFSVEERSADMLTIKLMRVYFDHFTEPEEKFSVYKLQKTDSGWRIFDRIPLP